MTEGQLQSAVLDTAKAFGWRIARFPAANFVRTSSGKQFVRPLFHDTKGFPDVLLVRDRLVAIEFKADRGKQTPEQLRWQWWLLEAGIEMHVWRPIDWNLGEIEAVLRSTASTTPALPAPEVSS